MRTDANCRPGSTRSSAGVQGKVENGLGPVDGPDAWDGYRAAIVAQTVLVSMSRAPGVGAM
jgi:hypothetical protein